jgi:dienelactone hydrolase
MRNPGPQTIAVAAFVAALLIMVPKTTAQSDLQQQFNAFVRNQAAALRTRDTGPKSAAEWKARRESLRNFLEDAWGKFSQPPVSLEPRVLGELLRDGYRVEKLAFQTLPGIWMTANAYVPRGEPGQRFPAVLCVHGHWPGAKQDPVVQSRCIGLVKLGFFVLCVDAFGAGERAIGTKLGEYHGEMTGAMLLPIGRPLSGIQVYENMRAVDYLQSRPDVIPDRIGITGASGGGNQSMYAGAFDERFRCIVPTCSVGTIQAYLTTACCMCEVVPGILRQCEEGDVLGLAVDRGLMVTSATQDAFQFSVDQARTSVARAREIADILQPSGCAKVKHTIIEAPHHYNQPMREAMYGWMTKHLKDAGDGSPIPEPPVTPEDPETLRCFPGDSRPEDWITIPRFAAAEGRGILEARRMTADASFFSRLASARTDAEKAALRQVRIAELTRALGEVPQESGLNLMQSMSNDGTRIDLTYDVEPGLSIVAVCDPGTPGVPTDQRRVAVILDVDQGADRAFTSDLAAKLRREGWMIVASELRSTGRFAKPSDKIGHAVDHNPAEWSLLIGRPLLGQWAVDLRRTLDAVETHLGSRPQEVLLAGTGASGVIAITAAALDERVSQTVITDSLISYVSDQPYRGQRLGILVPGILANVGDIGHIAALIAPRALMLSGGVNGKGDALPLDQLQNEFDYCRKVFDQYDASERLVITTLR